ncbi:MAG: DUF1800 domain-containing protein [Prochloraceae cyanobacterium]
MTVERSRLIHIINRLSFGPRPGDIEKIKNKGIQAYIQSQIKPESLAESPKLSQRLDRLETLKMSPVELFTEYNPRPNRREKISEEERKMRRKRARQVLQQAVEDRLSRAIESPRQLQEVMVDFWFNHFNVFARKGLIHLWVGNYDREVIRPNVFGRFRDLLGATARHPAMLVYLDNWQNTAPNSRGARGRFKGLNENYARELMELHTLGVDGGYTQEDVVSLARILTGWGVSRNPKRGDGSGFFFYPNRHDFSDKVFLGKTIKGSGRDEVEEALDILAAHPATARHISYKLAQYFVSDRPPEDLVNSLAKNFLATSGNIAAVLNTLFNSKEFLDPQYYGNKFKTPYQYVISLYRSSNPETTNLRAMLGMLRQLGMPLYGCSTPNGYQNTRDAWLNPDAMMRRVSFATAVARGYVNKQKPVDRNLLIATLGNNFSDRTLEVINNSKRNLQAPLILGSPEMMYR